MKSLEEAAAGPAAELADDGSAERRATRIRESLDIEMGDVKDGVLRMGSLVEDQILAAHDALLNRDAALAQKVITSDGRINEVQRAVTALVAMTIATQAPVASDLRFLLALDRVTYELERIGDHAGSVAKQARKLAGVTIMVTYDELTPMANLAARQVRDVVMPWSTSTNHERESWLPATTRSTGSTTRSSTTSWRRCGPIPPGSTRGRESYSPPTTWSASAIG